MEDGKGGESSLFPLVGGSVSASTTQSNSQWLCNPSFTTDVSVIDQVISSLRRQSEESDSDFDQPQPSSTSYQPQPSSTSYHQLLEDEEEREAKAELDVGMHSDSDSDTNKKKRKKHSRKKRKKKRSKDDDDFTSRNSSVRAWADSDMKPRKDYYFDTHGDHDNLVYGCLYRMDIPRYKPYNSRKQSGFDFQGLYRVNHRSSVFDRDGDVDVLDSKLKSSGRYWSAKNAALERHKNLKRLHLFASNEPAVIGSQDFIPLLDMESSRVSGHQSLCSNASSFEESWEDEVLRKTREFNKLTREHPQDVKVWLDFAEFQDRVASMQPQKGARIQMLEKKISILEKATEMNPDDEDLLVYLMKAYQQRESIDVLIGRWEKVLMRHSGSYKLWKEYLHILQGEFSRFKVSEMRRMYGHAIQALSTACSKQYRQAYQSAKPSSVDPAVVHLELGLVDIFLSLCRFEWQAGYRELATALFQAEIEYSLFSPSLLLSEGGKLRLFEHFWNTDGPRVGEEGAVGWSSWLEKEEENRQRMIKEETLLDEGRGGWTGWSEPLSKHKELDKNSEDVNNRDMEIEEDHEEFEEETVKQEEDTESMLKLLGIDVDVGAINEVKDTLTWAKWSQEEMLRDCNQWMPVRNKSCGKASQGDESLDGETDEQFLRVVLFEDVSEYLCSLFSEEARLSLLLQFIEFFGGDVSHRVCTNSSSWTENILSVEVLPNSILRNLRRVDSISVNSENSSRGNNLGFLLHSTYDSSKRTDVMGFLRNAILLCLTAFPRNHILEEAALVAEELSITKTDSSTPCQSLAKSLLKSDRQDVLLCGVYARREAVHGNIVHARRVFDMALSSVEGLPQELRSNASLLYFWYAEAELDNSSRNIEESSNRALHILSYLGSGTKYSPFECKPSSLQLLRAHQGFKERMKTIRLSWMRGIIDDQSIALTCSAALFEELTSGWLAGIEVLDDAFSMVLPERRSQSYQLEFLLNYYMRMLLRHHKQSSLSKFWQSLLQGLQIYPSSSELFSSLMEVSYLYTTPNKLRMMIDSYCHKKPSVVVWLFALSFEMSRGGSQHRIHGLFERALANDRLHKSVLLWRLYIAYEIDVAHDPSAARRIFFRAIHVCSWSKKLWLDGFLKLNSVLTAKELADLQEVMRDKELNLRTDIYEILLQDEIES
ncbi:hypothetical protein K2173_027128 [Erythroxylum novogranatense]|uniref:Protein NRDE2 homolog n=1 Tax=Erythroxylum novogranatense TaxID=1862640 RepID=A0AAV8TY83_9ROSI|nr:hypothetical protein K2173_027128 [Erythroxylum novogranatense]